MIFPEPFPARGAADEPRGGPVSDTIQVADQSNVGAVRRHAAVLATRAGLNDTERGTLAVVVTEAATNLARHAAGGIVALRVLGTPPGGVEMLALDRSPGIHDLVRAMADGYSTSGTAGQGLGAIRRMASEFDLFSSAEHGTALLARVWSAAADPGRVAQLRREGVVCVPVATELACGDGWVFMHQPHRTMVVLADGLGHGPEAARAADEAVRIAREYHGAPPSRIVEAAHGPLMATRGAALAIAEVVPSERIVRFAGVGNISGVIASPRDTRSMASHHGTVGHTMRKVQDFTYPWSDDSSLIMHSDGIMTRWRPDDYPGLVTHHPAIVAGVLYRDFNRSRDDATVIAFHGQRQ